MSNATFFLILISTQHNLYTNANCAVIRWYANLFASPRCKDMGLIAVTRGFKIRKGAGVFAYQAPFLRNHLLVFICSNRLWLLAMSTELFPPPQSLTLLVKAYELLITLYESSFFFYFPSSLQEDADVRCQDVGADRAALLSPHDMSHSRTISLSQ